MPRRERIGLDLLCACLLLSGCGRDAVAETRPVTSVSTPSAEQTAKARAEPRTPNEGLIVGEFALAPNAVIDGDTIRVVGIGDSIRLLSIDSEEKIQGKRDRAAIERDFRAYREAKRSRGNPMPKMATPLGDEAKTFAEVFFANVDEVRLERDDPKAQLGTFGRPLAYVFVEKDGRWTSYNLEAVRAGMSPYYTKYGYSQRFHSQFLRAEREAQEAKRGIWDPNALGYGDYLERRAWWDSRAEFIRAFRQSAVGRDDYVTLSHVDANARLEARIGQEATVLGVANKPNHFKGLVRIKMQGAKGNDFTIIVRDKDVYRRTRLEESRGEPLTVRGEIERYVRGDYETLQIVVTDPSQLGYPKETRQDRDR